MAKLPFSNLPIATALSGNEIVPIVQGGTTKRTNIRSISTGQLVAAVRNPIAADTTYYVRTDGSNGNDGSANDAAHAFLTLQGAWDYVQAYIDTAGYTITISLADGTYSGATDIKGLIPGQTGYGVIITGSSSAILTSTAAAYNGTLDVSSDASIALAGGIKIQNTGAGMGLQVNHAEVDTDGVTFGVAGQAQMNVFMGGVLHLFVNYSITAGAENHIRVYSGGVVDSYDITVTATGSPNFSNAFVSVFDSGMVESGNVTFSGTVTGVRARVNDNSMIQTFGGGVNYFPGDAGIQVEDGSVYDGKVGIDNIVDANANTVLGLTAGSTTSLSNYITITNASSGSTPSIGTDGTDSSVTFHIAPKIGGIFPQDFYMFGSGAGLYASGNQYFEYSGPGLQQFQFVNSNSTTGDIIGQHDYQSAGASAERYVETSGYIVSASSGSEDGGWKVKTISNGFGTLTDRIKVETGLVVGAPTGGDKGPSTVNAITYYQNGALYEVEKATQTGITSDNTFTDDPALKFTIAAGIVYRFQFFVNFYTNATPDFKWEITGPAGINTIEFGYKAIAPDGVLSSGVGSALATSVAITSASNGPGLIEITGIIYSGTAAGDIAFAWAQNTSDPADTIVRAGSYAQYLAVG